MPNSQINDQSSGSESGFPAKLAKPALRALAGAGFLKLEQLAGISEAELLQLHGMGPRAIGQIRQALSEQGLSLGD